MKNSLVFIMVGNEISSLGGGGGGGGGGTQCDVPVLVIKHTR